jgi:hypothetical protein
MPELSSNIYEIIDNAIAKLLSNALEDSIDKIFKIKVKEIFNPLYDVIVVQYYYNAIYNKIYIEFDLSKNAKHKYNKVDIVNNINKYIKNNFKRETNIYPEILFIDIDTRKQSVQNSYILTPFVIGYWKSLSGQYAFIEDNTRIELDLRQFDIQDLGEEYYTRKDEIYNRYFSKYKDIEEDYADKYAELVRTYGINSEIFKRKNMEYIADCNVSKGEASQEFEDELYTLNKEYDVNPDSKPIKNFEDFCNIVYSIRNRYISTPLSEEDKLEYMEKYTNIYIQYHNDKETFNTKLEELNSSYGVKINISIPTVFNDYKEAYKDFFGTELSDDMATNFRRIYIEIL